MANPKSPLLWIVGIGAILICLELWSAYQARLDGSSPDYKLLQKSLEELKLAVFSAKADVQDFRRVTERDLADLKFALDNSQKNDLSHTKATPSRTHGQLADSQKNDLSHTNATPSHTHGPHHAKTVLEEFHARQSRSCALPRLAEIVSEKVDSLACMWNHEKAESEGDACSFSLSGHCMHVFNNRTGCTFFGFPGNEQYQPASFILPDKVEDEIDLTDEEENMLKKIFTPCISRPRFFMVSSPLLSNGEHVRDMGTTRDPLILLSGGSPGIAQHFYFVVNEVSLGDSYRLGWHTESTIRIVVDIGANVGLFAISACLRFPKARILAFEPHPANFRFLKYNLKAAGCEGRVEAYNKGVSADGRHMKIYWHDSIGTSAYKKGLHYVRMKTITPATMFQIIGVANVSLMKVDCEGCEYEIVPLLPMDRVESLFCEVHHVDIYDLRNHTSRGFQDTKKKTEQICKTGNKWGIWVPA